MNAFHRFLESLTEHVYPLLRIFVGLMFAFHGAQKLFGLWFPFHPAIGSEIWFAGVIELVGGALVTLGLFTRVAAFLVSGEMAVAYVQGHWKFAFDSNFFPGINKGELAVVYSWLFLYFACRGAGRWSLDGWWSSRRREPAALSSPGPSA